MPRLLIDNREVEVPAGATILDAARKLGLDIPALCFRDGYPPSTSCMACLVKVKGVDRLVPSCATPTEEGMQVESETDELHRIRRTGLELLLGDHAGDCTAPCQNACPADVDIPLMLRQIAAGGFTEAITTVKKDIALPAVLGRVCTELCERACRRSRVGAPVAICLLKRFVADRDLASETPYQPPCKPNNGKTVAIVGAGPTGLTAAYHLVQQGYACTLLDQRGEPGGRLRYQISEEMLPRSVLDAEIAVIEQMGARFHLGTGVGEKPSLADLGSKFDAVLVAAGKLDQAQAERLGVPAKKGRVQADPTTHQTALSGVFVAGGAVGPSNLVVRSVADGKAAAVCIDQYLSGRAVTGPGVSFEFRSGRLSAEEIEQLAAGISDVERVVPCGALTEEQARAEALRCLHCDCGKQADCKLRHFAQTYGAKAARYRGDRRTFERHFQHAEVTFEPGKCIRCGLCVQIATEAGEPLGLTFIGRGFDVRVGVPFNRSIAEGLKCAARQCVEACPTGALTLRANQRPGAPTE